MMADTLTDSPAATSFEHRCKACAKPAPLPVLICFECSDCTGGVRPTAYCSTSCRATHRAEHQSKCQELNDLKCLIRAANLLQSAFLTWREALFDMKVKEVKVDGSIATIYEDRYKTDDSEGPLFPFPEHLIQGSKHKCAILTWSACNDASSWLFELGKKAFEGITKSVEECMLEIDIYFYKVFRHGNDGMQFPEFKHEVLIVTTNDGERYCIDLAGSQLHQFESIMPLDLYLDKFNAKIHKVKPYGSSALYHQEIMRGEHDRKLPPGYDFRVPQVQDEACSRFNIAVEEWEKSESLSIPQLLRLDQKSLAKGYTSLSLKLENCLKSFVQDYESGKISVTPHVRQEDYVPEPPKPDLEFTKMLENMGFSGTFYDFK